jgi:hypothetical protein
MPRASPWPLTALLVSNGGPLLALARAAALLSPPRSSFSSIIHDPLAFNNSTSSSIYHTSSIYPPNSGLYHPTRLHACPSVLHVFLYQAARRAAACARLHTHAEHAHAYAHEQTPRGVRIKSAREIAEAASHSCSRLKERDEMQVHIEVNADTPAGHAPPPIPVIRGS